MGSCFITQGAPPSALWQPRGVRWGGGWETGSRGRGHMYTYSWVTMYQHNCVKQLSSNLKKKKKKIMLKKRIHLNTGDVDLTPGQGTQPVSCNCWAHAPELESRHRNNAAWCTEDPIQTNMSVYGKNHYNIVK